MRRVADQRGVGGVEGSFEPDVGGQGRSNQFQSLLDDRLNVHVSSFAQPAAAESENTIDEHLGAPRRVHDIVNIAPQRAGWIGFLLREFTVTQDRPRYIVEIVGDAAS